MPKTACITLAFSLALATQAYAGKVYKIVNPDGSITYTDAPPAEHQQSEALDLPPVNQQKAVKVPASAPQQESGATGFAGYKEISLTSPENNATIPPGQETVTVGIALTPVLQPEHLIQLYYDAQPYGKPSSRTSVTLSQLFRGSHTIQAAVLDASGAQLIRSRPLTIHVKRGIRPQPQPSAPGSN